MALKKVKKILNGFWGSNWILDIIFVLSAQKKLEILDTNFLEIVLYISLKPQSVLPRLCAL